VIELKDSNSGCADLHAKGGDKEGTPIIGRGNWIATTSSPSSKREDPCWGSRQEKKGARKSWRPGRLDGSGEDVWGGS